MIRVTTARLGVLGLLLSSFGCASGGSPPTAARSETPPAPVQPEPPARVSPVADETPAAEPEPQETGAYGPMTVEIGSPEPEAEEPPTLAEAARLARERRAEEGGAPLAVITDETLPEYATGELSIAAEAPAPGDSPAPEASAPEATAEERGEEFWRNRVREARIRWRDLVEELARLEQEAQDLRQRFYAEDDGFYRDSQIKPAWDRALDRLGEVRDQLELARAGVDKIVQEGRLEGALPGWLREGIEYEPTLEEPEEGLGIHEASEPQVIGEDDQDDGR